MKGLDTRTYNDLKTNMRHLKSASVSTLDFFHPGTSMTPNFFSLIVHIKALGAGRNRRCPAMPLQGATIFLTKTVTYHSKTTHASPFPFADSQNINPSCDHSNSKVLQSLYHNYTQNVWNAEDLHRQLYGP